MPSFLSISADDAAMQRMDIAAVSSIGAGARSIESKGEIERANGRLKKWHHPCGVSGVFRSRERGQRVVSMRGRQRVVSYIMPPRGDGMGAGGRQQGECHQEDSLTLALCCEGTTRTRMAGRRGKMEPLNGVKEISPL